jgi:hypothetical protein
MDPKRPVEQHEIQPMIELLRMHYPGANKMTLVAFSNLVMRTTTRYVLGKPSCQLPKVVLESAKKAGHIILTT